MYDDIELIICNEKFEKIGVIYDYSSLIWNPKYNEVGEFEIYIEATPENIDLLREKNYVFREDDDYVGVIENIKITFNSNSLLNMMTISGRFSEKILGQRIIWTQTSVDASLEDSMRALIKQNVIEPENVNRKIDIIKLGNVIGDTPKISSQYTGDNLLTVIQENAKETGLGFKNKYEAGNFYFGFYRGTDRSRNQLANTWVVFSDEHENLATFDYQYLLKGYSNVALVRGEGEGLKRKTAIINDNEFTGLDRYELDVDARDLQSNNGEIKESEYTQKLQKRGKEKLADVGILETIEGSAEEDDEKYIYKRDYFLGDIVQVELTEYNFSYVARIVSVIESKDENGYNCIPKFEMVSETGNTE